MGVVYKACQVALKRVVALKMILHSRYSGTEGRKRFLAEAEAVARLAHPHIVQIYEIGQHDGAPFFSLEYCPGGSLDRKLARTPLEPRAAAELLEVLARAVQAAHQANVVHRDLKPANVLLAADGTPKITDFGLAKRLDEVGQTHQGAVMGTPSYMAPEQASGANDQIGPCTDVYALGAILYELLTGHPPFRASSTWATLAQVREREPVPPSQVQPGVPRDLETICLKALHKQPARRYARACELADDVRRFLDHVPILARRTPAWERARKWARRKPMAAAFAAALMLAALATSLGGIFYARYESERSMELQRQIERRDSFERRWDEGQKAEAAGLLALARGAHDEADQQFQVAAGKLERALTLLETEGGSWSANRRAEVEAKREEVARHLAEQEARRRLRERAQTFLRKDYHEVLFHEISPTTQDEAARRVTVVDLAPKALAPFGLSAERSPKEAAKMLLADRSRFESPRQLEQVAQGCYEVLLVWVEAESDLPNGGATRAMRLLRIADALAREHGLEVPRAFYLRRSHCSTLAGDKKQAAADLAQAGTMKPHSALDHFLAGLASWKKGDTAAASSACDKALRRQGDHFWAQYLLALCEIRTGSWAEARASLTACLGRRPDFLWGRLQRASACVELNQWEAAQDDFELGLRQAAQAKNTLAQYVGLVNRSTMWLRQKRWGDADADLQKALRLRPELHLAYVNLALGHEGRGEWRLAVKEWTRALERIKDASLYRARARAFLQCKDRRSARRDFEAVIAMGHDTATTEQYVSALVELGHEKHLDRDYKGALSDYDAALRQRPDFPEAHRQRAETLRAQKRYAEAGAALDRYLVKGKPDFNVYLVRGLIHAALDEDAAAINAYGEALRLKPDPEAFSHRGWAHLQMDAPRPALGDFESALKKGPRTFEALCGRAMASVRIAKVKEAVADVEEAVPKASKPEELMLTACVYAWASALAATRTPRDRNGPLYEEKAVELLTRALRKTPREHLSVLWKERVQKEEALASVRIHPRIQRLLKELLR
jgi:tetratricopeptide (TPR) repeat protein